MASTIFVVDSSPAVRRLVEQISKLESHDITPFRFRDLLDQPADGGTTVDDKDG